MQDFRYLSGATTLQLDEDACIDCGMCEIVCPHGVFEQEPIAEFTERLRTHETGRL